MNKRRLQGYLTSLLSTAVLMIGILTLPSAFAANPVQGKRQAPRIRIEGVDAGEKKLLLNATTNFVQFLAESLAVPTELFMANGPAGPSYSQGMITLAYPYYSGSETKTPEQSIPINLHEVAHAVFDESVHKYYSAKPELLWGFFTVIDNVA
ncbi:MAG: hypothetical protein EOP06_32180, partial [Proteobacteria bacterium]